MLRATDLAETAGASEIQTKIDGMKSPSSRFGPTTLSERLVSLDAYRGFVMLLMMAEVLRLSRVSRARCLKAGSGFPLASSITCRMDRLFAARPDPAVVFICGRSGVAVFVGGADGQRPVAETDDHSRFHAGRHPICLGVFLRSVNRPRPISFEDTLTQIGLGYGFLFLLGMRSMRIQWIAFGVILVGYWLAFALHRRPRLDSIRRRSACRRIGRTG